MPDLHAETMLVIEAISKRPEVNAAELPSILKYDMLDASSDDAERALVELLFIELQRSRYLIALKNREDETRLSIRKAFKGERNNKMAQLAQTVVEDESRETVNQPHEGGLPQPNGHFALLSESRRASGAGATPICPRCHEVELQFAFSSMGDSVALP
jgi:hypothetical protein